MSYILEALKKADQERDLGSVPDLDTSHEPKRAVKWQYRWAGVMAVLLGLNLVFIALLTSYNWNDKESPVAGQPSAEPGTTMKSAKPPPSPTRVVDRLEAQAKPLPEERPTVVRETRKIGSAPQGRKGSPPAGPAMTRTSPPSVAAPVAAPAAPAPVPLSAGSETVPFLDEMPLEFRSNFPTPRLDVHVYDEDAARRFILVDLQKYREGDELDNGALLVEILPDGVQLEFRGEQFRMKR